MLEARTLLLYTQFFGYFVFMIAIGLVTKRWIRNMSDFFLSGRELSYVTIGLGMAGIIFSGATLPSISGLAITHSVWIGSLYMCAWAIGIIVFGKFFAPAIRRSGTFTLAEWAEVRYDSRTRTVVAVATSIASFGALFSQVVGLGNNLTALTNIPYWLTTLGIVLLCTFYIYVGGFWAVSISDMSHMTVIMIALSVTFVYLTFAIGSPIEAITDMPSVSRRVFTFHGDAPDNFLYSLQFPSLLSLLFGWFLTQMGCQYYWMRAVGGRSETAVRKGYYLSGIIAILFGATLLPMFGIYALLMFGEGGFAPETAFGLVIKSLPMGLDGLLLLALVAACMSTYSTAIFGVVSPVTRDIYQRLFIPYATSTQLTKASRTITLVVATISYIVAQLWKSGAAYGLAFMWAFSAPTAATLLLGYLWNRVTVKAAFWGELGGLSLTLIWYLIGFSGIAHPMWIGFWATVIIVVVITLTTKPKYYADEGFNAGLPSKANGLAQSNIECIKQYQESQFKESMRNLMRPCLGGKRYKGWIEKKHNESYTLADLVFPHITGKYIGNAMK